MNRMQGAFDHAIGLVLAVGLAILGRYVSRNPERMIRIFTFGTGSENGFPVAFSKIVGRFWCAIGIFGGFMYLLLIANDLLYPH
jgi:hypothetical protein